MQLSSDKRIAALGAHDSNGEADIGGDNRRSFGEMRCHRQGSDKGAELVRDASTLLLDSGGDAADALRESALQVVTCMKRAQQMRRNKRRRAMLAEQSGRYISQHARGTAAVNQVHCPRLQAVCRALAALFRLKPVCRARRGRNPNRTTTAAAHGRVARIFIEPG